MNRRPTSPRQTARPPGRLLSNLALIAAGAGFAAAAACDGASTATSSASRYVDAVPPNVGHGGGNTTTSGLPCDVADLLTQYCVTCHSSPPADGVPVSLVNYADLTASSAVEPGMTVAGRAVVRMQDAQSPMPPGVAPSVPAASVATMQAWVDSGLPAGACGADAGPSPYDTPPVCSSGLYWTGGEDGGDIMHPGRACISCHIQNGEGEAPILSIAGTVYPTAHEPDECRSVGLSGATVEIRTSNGQVRTLHVNSNGNFQTEQGGLVFPFAAKVLYEGRERAMSALQTIGDCNGCHTQDGTQGAPGRILLP